jgi:hypothetical protein
MLIGLRVSASSVTLNKIDKQRANYKTKLQVAGGMLALTQSSILEEAHAKVVSRRGLERRPDVQWRGRRYCERRQSQWTQFLERPKLVV